MPGNGLGPLVVSGRPFGRIANGRDFSPAAVASFSGAGGTPPSPIDLETGPVRRRPRLGRPSRRRIARFGAIRPRGSEPRRGGPATSSEPPARNARSRSPTESGRAEVSPRRIVLHAVFSIRDRWSGRSPSSRDGSGNRGSFREGSGDKGLEFHDGHAARYEKKIRGNPAGLTDVYARLSSRNRAIRRRRRGCRERKTDEPLRDPDFRMTPASRRSISRRAAFMSARQPRTARRRPSGNSRARSSRGFRTPVRQGLVAMEACSPPRRRRRVALAAGRAVLAIAPTCAIRSRLRVNDAADAETNAAAVRRPGMRFVEPKSPDRQAAAILRRRGGSPREPARGWRAACAARWPRSA